MFDRKIGDTDSAADIEVERNPLNSTADRVAVGNHLVLYVFMAGMLVVFVDAGCSADVIRSGSFPCEIICSLARAGGVW
jgi:hypothetical protein